MTYLKNRLLFIYKVSNQANRNEDKMINALTQKAYSGSNQTELEAVIQYNGFNSIEFATLNQWNQLGKKVKQGSKAAKLKFFKEEIKDGRAETKLRYFYVFNKDQVE